MQAILSTEEEQQGLFYIYASPTNIQKAKKEKKNLPQLLVQYIQAYWDDEVGANID